VSSETFKLAIVDIAILCPAVMSADASPKENHQSTKWNEKKSSSVCELVPGTDSQYGRFA
jgi:hypothetical protein